MIKESNTYPRKNALVVLNYNDSTTTASFLQLVKKYSSIDHIIVVDNCSTDDSYRILKNYESTKIEVIKSPQNGGYAFGNNIGCTYAMKRYNPDVLFVSNPDVSFNEDIIQDLENVFDEDNTIGVAAPIVNQGYNVWNLPSFLGVLESILLIWFNLDKKALKESLLRKKQRWTKVGVVEGSFFAIKTSAFKKVKGFDERTFLYYEENMLAHKLSNFGYKVVVLNNKRYNHNHSVSIKKSYRTKVRAFKHFHHSMQLYISDYLKCNGIQKMIFEFVFAFGYLERIIYDCISSIKYFCRFK